MAPLNASLIGSANLIQPSLQNYYWKLDDPNTYGSLAGSWVTSPPNLWSSAGNFQDFTAPLIYTGEDFAANPSKYVNERSFQAYQSTPWRAGAKWFQSNPQSFYVVEDHNFNQNADDWVGDGFHEGDSPKSLIAGIAHFGQGTYNDLLFAGLIQEFSVGTWLLSGIPENPLATTPPFVEALIIGSIVAIASACAAGVAATVAGAGAAIAAGAGSASSFSAAAGAGGSFTAVAATSSVIAPAVPAVAAAGGGLAGTMATVSGIAGAAATGISLVIKALNMAGVDTGSAGDVVATAGAAAQGAAGTIGASNVSAAVSQGAGTVNAIIQKAAPSSQAAAASSAATKYAQGTADAISSGKSSLQAGIDTAQSVVTDAAQQGGLLPKQTSVAGASTPSSIGDYASSVVLAVPPAGPNLDPNVDTQGGVPAFVAMVNKYASDEKERKSGRFYVPMVPPDAMAAYIQRRRLGASVSESLRVAQNVAPYHWRWATLSAAVFMPTTALMDRLNKLIALHAANEQIANAANVDPSAKLLAGCAHPDYVPPNNMHLNLGPGAIKLLSAARLSAFGGMTDSGGSSVALLGVAAAGGLLYALAKRKKGKR